MVLLFDGNSEHFAHVSLDLTRKCFKRLDNWDHFTGSTRMQQISELPSNKSTICPGSSDQFYIVTLLYKMGHYFLDTVPWPEYSTCNGEWKFVRWYVE